MGLVQLPGDGVHLWNRQFFLQHIGDLQRRYSVIHLITLNLSTVLEGVSSIIIYLSSIRYRCLTFYFETFNVTI